MTDLLHVFPRSSHYTSVLKILDLFIYGYTVAPRQCNLTVCGNRALKRERTHLFGFTAKVVGQNRR